jgi:hypothetical protein
MHYAMPHRSQSITPAALFDPIHQSAHRYRVIRRCHWPRKIVRLAYAFHPQSGLWQSNPLNPALQNPSGWVPGLEHCKLDA